MGLAPELDTVQAIPLPLLIPGAGVRAPASAGPPHPMAWKLDRTVAGYAAFIRSSSAMNRRSVSAADGRMAASSSSSQNRTAASRCADVRTTPRTARCTGDAAACRSPCSSTSSTLGAGPGLYPAPLNGPAKSSIPLTSRGSQPPPTHGGRPSTDARFPSRAASSLTPWALAQALAIRAVAYAVDG